MDTFQQDFDDALPDGFISGFSGTVSKLTSEEKDAIKEELFENPEEFCREILPTKFSKKMPWVHKGILAIVLGRTDWLLRTCTEKELGKIENQFFFKEEWDNPDCLKHKLFVIRRDENGKPVSIDLARGRYTLIIMPRGFSKTTLIGLAAMLYKILYCENKFIVYVSETATAAELQLNNVKAELSSNPMIHELFGNLKPDRSSELKWTSGFFQTLSGVVVTARGRGGQIRGLNVNAQRPDCILFDDVEDKESVKTADQREKTREWCFGDMMPALPEMDENATIIGLGTVLHQEALLMTLRNDPEWTTCMFGAIDEDGDPLWEDNMSLAKLEAKKKSYALAGMLGSYYREYESKIKGESGRLFSGPFILKPEWAGELDCVAQVMDPAISESADADFCALAVAGITTRGHILLMDYWQKRGALPQEQVDVFFEKSIQHNVQKHGIEAVAYQKALVHLVRGEMFRKKRYFVIEEIRHGKTGKDERIRGILGVRYPNGYIAHVRRFPEYEAQLLDYPDGKKDGPDAFAMAITLLDPYAANMGDPESDEFATNEYEALPNWRQY